MHGSKSDFFFVYGVSMFSIGPDGFVSYIPFQESQTKRTLVLWLKCTHSMDFCEQT